MKKNTFKKIIRFWAVYDLILLIPFITPGITRINIEWMKIFHERFMLSWSFPPFFDTHIFYVNLMWSFLILWSILRLLKPKTIIWLFDTIWRFVFAYLIIYYILVYDISQIFIVFLITELIWWSIQTYAYISYKRAKRNHKEILKKPKK